MSALQQLRLYSALKKMVNFKNEKLLNTLKKATIGKQIGEMS